MNEQEEFEFRYRLEQEQAHEQPSLRPGVDVAANAEAIEPGVYNETEPVEQKLINNINAAGAGVTLPQSIASIAKMAGIGEKADTVAKYAGRMGENAMGKVHGTSSAQFRQLGRENFSDAMRDSYEAGDANLLQGSIGREKAIEQRVKDLGQKIGDIRTQADAAGPKMAPADMAAKIRQELAPDYMAGGKNFEHEAALERQLKNIEAMPEGGVSNFAQRATDINKAASKNKLIQPTTAETDIANRMAKVNDATIAERLPGMSEEYAHTKEKFGNAKTLLPMELRGEAKDALGATPNTAVGMAKQALGSLVNFPKFKAHVGFGAEAGLKGVAGILKNTPNYPEAVTTQIMMALTNNPASLGKYAAPLAQAAQKSGNNGIAATHFILSQQDPEYQKLINGTATDTIDDTNP